VLLLKKLRKILVSKLRKMSWGSIFTAFLFYCVSSWMLLFAAGEEALITQQDFFYWLVVTGSTVGYGDYSPSTTAGKWIVALYVIPVGLSIFAYVLGRIASFVVEQWRKGVKGLKSLNESEHILVIGWNGPRTMQLIKLLIREHEAIDDTPKIVLCVRADIENPLPDHIGFVKVTSFNKDDDMNRCNIAQASVIIVDNPEDDLTMTTSLYASHRNPDAHILAYFHDESLVKLLNQHCPNVECMPSVAVEMLAKSAIDPGSSVLHHDLLNVDDEGQAQFSSNLPEHQPDLTVKQVFIGLKQHHGATLIGLAKNSDRKALALNPDFDQTITSGDKIYYIAPQRIKHIEWGKLYV